MNAAIVIACVYIPVNIHFLSGSLILHKLAIEICLVAVHKIKIRKNEVLAIKLSLSLLLIDTTIINMNNGHKNYFKDSSSKIKCQTYGVFDYYPTFIVLGQYISIIIMPFALLYVLT